VLPCAPYTPLQLAAALKYLGILDGKRVTRATVDLLFLEVIKDQHRPGKKTGDASDREGITLEVESPTPYHLSAPLPYVSRSRCRALPAARSVFTSKWPERLCWAPLRTHLGM
jgi:hypothetical protein